MQTIQLKSLDHHVSYRKGYMRPVSPDCPHHGPHTINQVQLTTLRGPLHLSKIFLDAECGFQNLRELPLI